MIEKLLIISCLFTIMCGLCWILGLLIFFVEQIGYRTWYLTYTRLYILISFFLLLIWLFYISYMQLGKTVHLSKNWIRLKNYYLYLINNSSLDWISIIIIHFIVIIIIYILIYIIKYYMKWVRVSFQSVYYYVIYKNITFIEWKFSTLLFLSVKIDLYFAKKLAKIFLNGDLSDFEKNKYLVYIHRLLFKGKLELILRIMKKAPFYLIIGYYIYLIYTTGEIVLEKYYYIVIFLPIYRVIINILYFLILGVRDLISTLSIIESTYDLENTFCKVDWFSIIKNVKDKEGFNIIYETLVKIEDRELKNDEDVRNYLKQSYEEAYILRESKKSRFTKWYEKIINKL